MKSQFDDLEAELRAMEPAAPPARLEAEVIAALPSAPDRPVVTQGSSVIFARFGPILAIAAILAVAAGYFFLMPQSSVLEEVPAIASEQATEQPSPSIANDAAATTSEEIPSEVLALADPLEEPELLDVPTDNRLAAAGFRPVHAENALLSRVDDGLVTLEGGIPARRYRYRFLDTVVWEDPKDGAQVEMRVPREELVVVPVRTF